MEFREIDERSVAEVFSLAPFGCGNPAPMFAALNVEVAGPPAVMKEKHLRVMLRQNGRTLVLKAWNFAGRAAELQAGARVDVAFTLEDDAYAAGARPAAGALCCGMSGRPELQGVVDTPKMSLLTVSTTLRW